MNSRHKKRFIKIGYNIQHCRALLGMSREQLSKAAKYSVSYIQKIESSEVALSLRALFAIAAALGVEPTELLR